MAFEILVYLIIFFGVSGMALGAYGAAAPRLQHLLSRLASAYQLVRAWRHNLDDDIEDDLYEADGAPANQFEPRLHPGLLVPRDENPQSAPGPLPPAYHSSVAASPSGVSSAAAPLASTAPGPPAYGAPPNPDTVGPQPGPAAADPEVEPREDEAREDELLAFFQDEASTLRAPAAIKEALPQVSAQDLLVEAREVRRLLGARPERRG